jgi:hypothetical protein
MENSSNPDSLEPYF